jgi:preprotein translocase subunit SecY
VIPRSVAGTAVLMWIGELISQRGIGNGMSMIIFASVVSGLPYGYYSIIEVNKWFWFVLIVLPDVGDHRRRRVRRARANGGSRCSSPNVWSVRRMYGGQNTYIPLKVNQAGRDPDHLRQLDPAAAGDLLERPRAAGTRLVARAARRVRRQVHHQQPEPVYMTLFACLIIAFAYFYNSIAFDPVRQADQIRRQGGFIPGVRPGPQTERYLAKVVNRITLPGAVFIAVIALLPYLLVWGGNINTFGFAGPAS